MLVLVPAFLAHPNATTLDLDQFAVRYSPNPPTTFPLHLHFI